MNVPSAWCGRAVGLVGTALLLVACGQTGVAPTPAPSPATCQAVVQTPAAPRGAAGMGLVVRLRPGVPLEQAADVAAGAGADLVKVRRRARALLVRPRPGAAATQLAARFSADPRVLRAEPEVRVRALQVTPNDPLYPGQWGLTQIHAPAAWQQTTGSGVKVAVLDTGMASHPDVPDPLEGYDFVADDPDPTDPGDPDSECTSHGTMVASVVAARTNNGRGMAGVTWGPSGARLLVARVLDEHGNGSLLDVEEALRWAAEHGARVANLSLGTDTPAPCPESLRQAVEEVVSRGVLVVAAAGNNGPGAGTVVCPANLDAVVAVAATGPDGRVAYYSSRGPEVDLAAPGGSNLGRCSEDVRTASPSRTAPEDYPCAAGTSFAAPHVTGVAALVLSQNPGWSPAQVRQRLQQTAQDVDPVGRDPDSGCGLVRADRALSGEADPFPACP